MIRGLVVSGEETCAQWHAPELQTIGVRGFGQDGGGAALEALALTSQLRWYRHCQIYNIS